MPMLQLLNVRMYITYHDTNVFYVHRDMNFTCVYVYYFTVPDNITEVMLMCEVLNQINQCIVEWEVRT